MKNIIALSTLLLLATPNLFAGTSSKDWKYEKITIDSKEYCSASTKTKVQPENEDLISAILTLNIPTDETTVPTISVEMTSKSVETLNLTALIGKTNNSDSQDLTLLALAPDLDEKNQVLQLPIWKAETLTDDLISDNSLDLEIMSNDGPIEMLNFSLRGSSKVIKAMAKDCLGVSSFEKPRVLSKLLTSNQNTLITALNETPIPVVNKQINLNKFYNKSAALQSVIKSALIENLSLQEIVAESEEAESALDQIVSDLADKQELDSSLADEKAQIIREERSLPREKNQLLRQIEVDQVDVPVLRSEYKSSERKYNAAKALSKELTEQMEDLENDIQFYVNELGRVQVSIENTEDQGDITVGQLNEAKRDLDRLRNNSDLDRKQRNLDILLSELSAAQSKLDNFRPRQRVKDRLRDNNEYQTARRDARQLSTQLEGIKEEISQLRNTIRNKKNQADAKQQQANQTKNALNTAKSQKPVLEQKKRENLNKAQRLNAERKSAHDLRQVKTAERKAACDAGDQNLCRSLGREVQELKRTVDGLDRKVVANNSQRAKMERQISQYENDINNLGPKISQLQNQANRLNNEASQLDQNRSRLKNRMESIGTRLNDAERVKDRVKSRVSDRVWARNNELINEVNRLDSRSSRLANEINNIRADISDLRSLVRSLNQELDNIDADLADLKTEEANIIQDLSSKRSQRDDLASSSEYKTARQKTQRAKSVYDEAKAAFILADSRLRNSLDRVTEIEEKIENNIVRLPAIEEELVIVAEEIETLKSEEKAQAKVAKELNQDRIRAENGQSKAIEIILSTEALLTNNI